MSLHRNRVQMTVTGTPGTGTITLNAATSGYQSFASAYGADATVDILITENTSWEVARNCTYTNSGTTVTRGTLEASSTGSAVSFTSAAVVSVIATAASGNNWGLNEISASPTGAGVTGVVGTLHILDISGLTADQDFTLPATCAVGDRVGVFIKTGDPDYELLLKPASGDTINGGSPAAEWSRLLITGECVIFRCITADTDWIVEYDGRIPCNAMLREDTATTLSHATFTKISLDAEVYDVGDIADPTTNNRMNCRRAGNYLVFALISIANLAVDSRVIPRIYKNGSVELEVTRSANVISGTGIGSGSAALVLAVGDFVELYGYWNVASGTGTKDTDVATGVKPYLVLTEVLK